MRVHEVRRKSNGQNLHITIPLHVIITGLISKISELQDSGKNGQRQNFGKNFGAYAPMKRGIEGAAAPSALRAFTPYWRK